MRVPIKTNDDDQPTLVFIDLTKVMEMTGRSKSSIYEDPTFPLPVSFSEPGRTRRHARWLLHEVEGWIQEKSLRRTLWPRSAGSICSPSASCGWVKRRTTPKRVAKASVEADA